MSSDNERISRYVAELLAEHTEDELARRLEPDHSASRNRVRRGASGRAIRERLELLALSHDELNELMDERAVERASVYERNIENFVGTVKVPLGLAGPLRVNGLFAKGDYYLPLATTEAALVASYNRGAGLITAAGGCSAMLLSEGVSRAPGFLFDDIASAGRFAIWAQGQLERFKEIAASTSCYGELIQMKMCVEGNHTYLVLDYRTGDASGQNMVTIATEAICSYIACNSPVKPRKIFVEANLSGDKKASFQSFQTVRGKKVSVEVEIGAALIEKHLKTTPAALTEYWRISAVGGVLSGTIGVQGHYANGLAALYLACGQDVACVSESAVGVTRFEITEGGALYASATLPNLIVGTVGGGTGLPSQRACLEILGLAGAGNARAFAEVCAGLCLAGELSLMASMCSGDFSRAHRTLARGEQ